LLYVVGANLNWNLYPALWVVAILTMVVGTVIGVTQSDIKRLLAYSAIAHAGFILAGASAFLQTRHGYTSDGIVAALFYLFTYGIATVGAFAVVTLVRERDEAGNLQGEATGVAQWAGLGKRHPWLAGAFTVMLLSFAGIPLTAGFVGKFAVFSAASAVGGWPLALVGVGCSAATAFFYIRIIVSMYFSAADEPAPVMAVRGSGLTVVAIAIAVIVTIVLGVYPSALLGFLHHAGNLAFFTY
jgi:NADH-quinone oxidoreductase subunit N